MSIPRGLLVSAVVAVTLLAILRCAGSSNDAGDQQQAAVAKQGVTVRTQGNVNRGSTPAWGRFVDTIAPGKTWQHTFRLKLGPESVSLDGSSHLGAGRYRDLEFRLLRNDWQQHGVSGRVGSVRVETYSFDIWQFQNAQKLLVPRASDSRLDLEDIGKLSRDEVANMRWQQDPRREGFDPAWDLRRGRGRASRATFTVSVTAPHEVAWPGGKRDRIDGGDLAFGSSYQGVGVLICLRYDPDAGVFRIYEGSCSGGALFSNPHRERFAAAR